MYLLVVYALLVPQSIVGAIQDAASTTYEDLVDGSAGAWGVMKLPLTFVCRVIANFCAIAMVTVFVCIQGTVAIPYYAFIAGALDTARAMPPFCFARCV